MCWLVASRSKKNCYMLLVRLTPLFVEALLYLEMKQEPILLEVETISILPMACLFCTLTTYRDLHLTLLLGSVDITMISLELDSVKLETIRAGIGGLKPMEIVGNA